MDILNQSGKTNNQSRQVKVYVHIVIVKEKNIFFIPRVPPLPISGEIYCRTRKEKSQKNFKNRFGFLGKFETRKQLELNS